jgi:hypothetical protein
LNVDNFTETTIIQYEGHEFNLSKPSVGIVLRILRVAARLGKDVRARVARAVYATILEGQMVNAGSGVGLGIALGAVLDVLLEVLAELREEDLLKLGAATLQFKDDSEGQDFIREHGIKLTPISKALVFNVQHIARDEDLREAVRVFVGGLQDVLGIRFEISSRQPEPEKAGR